MMTAAIRHHDAEVAARFDEAEARFKPGLAADDVRLAGVIEAIGPLAGLRVLDLGCGKGRFASPLAERGARVVGVDLSQAMLVHAKGIERARAAARRLPFADATFDVVFAVEVVEHVGDVRPILREARRVLRPGGRLVLVDKNKLAIDARRPWLPSSLLKWIDERRGLWMYPSGGPVRERWFVPGRLRDEITRAGFSRSRFKFLLTPDESRRRLHRAIPAARLLTLWVAEVAQSPDASSPKRNA